MCLLYQTVLVQFQQFRTFSSSKFPWWTIMLSCWGNTFCSVEQINDPLNHFTLTHFCYLLCPFILIAVLPHNPTPQIFWEWFRHPNCIHVYIVRQCLKSADMRNSRDGWYDTTIIDTTDADTSSCTINAWSLQLQYESICAVRKVVFQGWWSGSS